MMTRRQAFIAALLTPIGALAPKSDSQSAGEKILFVRVPRSETQETFHRLADDLAALGVTFVIFRDAEASQITFELTPAGRCGR